MENNIQSIKKDVLSYIEKYPVIPVFYHEDLEVCKAILKACYEGGIRVFEFVNRGEAAENNLKELIQYKNQFFPEMTLGIGTIMSADSAERFITLGAEFLVSPIFLPCIAEVATENKILWIPGCMTPSEIANAKFANCTLIKLFPGESLGPGFLKSIKPIFPTLKFMPTGGVDITEENIKSWTEAGVFAVGLGSKLFKKSGENYDYNFITENCKHLLNWTNKRE